MKRLVAAVLVAMLVVGSSGCISVHKTETHEARTGAPLVVANYDHSQAQPGDCHEE